jgi:hypothetical protein
MLGCGFYRDYPAVQVFQLQLFNNYKTIRVLILTRDTRSWKRFVEFRDKAIVVKDFYMSFGMFPM